MALELDVIRRAPKVLLHDHLDGGLRPSTIIDLASRFGYRSLPTTDPSDLGTWMRRGADRLSLELYLETFAHTVAVMQQGEALARVAEICFATLALATDYDCWHEGHDDVTVEAVMATMKKNVSVAKKALAVLAENLPDPTKSVAHGASRGAVMTAPSVISAAARDRLGWLLPSGA